ncbi:hypothetical protein HJB67_12930 [Rhizobium lentis]|uniref:hypothetical protein n=1 Tax=Rhizobium lentis TaxID=1138194 RepID=UPI001C834B17|nr:hypothetical protein [Rhizobium lentis]MBX5010859.1 hypothetical protein [Rhizobium lentis]
MGEVGSNINGGGSLPPPLSKKCPSCEKTKTFSDFYKDASKAGGLSSSCKDCTRKRAKIYRANNPETIKARLARWVSENKEQKKQKNAEWAADNPEKVKESNRVYREKNAAKVAESRKRWADANPEYMAEKGRRAARKRLATPKGRIEAAVRSVLGMSLKGKKAGRRTFALLGYSSEDLMRQLESLFQPGMSWENYGKGGWEVDHKRPLASFTYDDADSDQFKAAWSLDNLQPLWMSDNRRKGAKILH